MAETPVVTFSTNLVAADDIVAALDTVLADYASKLDPPEHIVLLSAVRASLKNAADDVRPKSPTPTLHPNAVAAAKAWAARVGVIGRKGGWLYNAKGRAICQGWDSYVSILVNNGIILDLDGERLATRSDVEKQHGNRWAGLRRNVFDRKPVLLKVSV